MNAYFALYKLRKAEAALEERLAVESAEAFGQALDADQVLGRIDPEGVVGSAGIMPKMTAYDLLLALTLPNEYKHNLLPGDTGCKVHNGIHLV